MDTNAVVIEFLTTKMQAEGISVNALAKTAHLPQTSLNRHLNGGGTMNVNLLTTVCDALNVSLTDVFAFVEERKRSTPKKKKTHKPLSMRQ